MIKLLFLLVAVTLAIFILLKIFKKIFLVLFALLIVFGLYSYFGWNAIVRGELPYPKPLRSFGEFFFPVTDTGTKA